MLQTELLTVHLQQNGFCYGVGEVPKFLAFASSLGTVVLESDICLRDSHTYASRRDAIPPHSDGPECKYVGLYCIQQQSPVVPLVLIDLRDMPAQLSNPCKSFLREATFTRGKSTFRILSGESSDFCLYYPPWLVQDPETVSYTHLTLPTNREV